MAFVPPGLQQRSCAVKLDRQGAERVRPEERIERARGSREQLAGVKGVALLGHPLAQLIDPEREQAGLLQGAVELAERRRKILAFTGDLGGFGRRVLRRRGAELLEALLDLSGARLELLDFALESVRRRIELLPEVGKGLRRDVVAADVGFDLIERGLDLLERGLFGRLAPCARSNDDARSKHRARSQQSARHAPKHERAREPRKDAARPSAT